MQVQVKMRLIKLRMFDEAVGLDRLNHYQSWMALRKVAYCLILPVVRMCLFVLLVLVKKLMIYVHSLQNHLSLLLFETEK